MALSGTSSLKPTHHDSQGWSAKHLACNYTHYSSIIMRYSCLTVSLQVRPGKKSVFSSLPAFIRPQQV